MSTPKIILTADSFTKIVSSAGRLVNIYPIHFRPMKKGTDEWAQIFQSENLIDSEHAKKLSLFSLPGFQGTYDIIPENSRTVIMRAGFNVKQSRQHPTDTKYYGYVEFTPDNPHSRYRFTNIEHKALVPMILEPLLKEYNRQQIDHDQNKLTYLLRVLKEYTR